VCQQADEVGLTGRFSVFGMMKGGPRTRGCGGYRRARKGVFGSVAMGEGGDESGAANTGEKDSLRVFHDVR